MTKQQDKPSRSFAGIAGIIAAATLISKVFGLVRQLVISAAFGLGPAAAAFQYAYTIPGFLLILLGGINGPFYSAVVSVLAKRKKEEAAPLLETIMTLIGGILFIVSIVIVITAPLFVDLFTMPVEEGATKQLVQEIAIRQLRIMAPMAVLAGLIGIGFGALNTANVYWLPSISPLFSSTALVAAVGILYLQVGNKISTPEYAMLGGTFLAVGTLVGALLQWFMQIAAQTKAGMGRIRLRFDFNQPAVKEVLRIMGPATFSSGMLQFNLYTDLYFAGFIGTQVAPALANAGLLVQTPLGIISNVILVRLLPVFARLADPQNWEDLKLKIREGLLLSAFTMLPLGALMVALANPIVKIVYERGAFNPEATQLVASLLVVNGIGMFIYLGRDVLVRVFYALGDGNTPFRISMINIFLNGLFDYLFIKVFNLGAPGLVLATVGVNCSSVFMLLFLLNRKLNGLPIVKWSLPILGLAAGSVVAGAASFATSLGMAKIINSDNLLIQLLQLSISGFAGLAVFGVVASMMNIPEVNDFAAQMRRRFLKR
ncbi:integral membrane protein MviN [Rivularia sp. PCC 7116]|uniref:murein biosynthesis integral membrane protein MurJ n=1 Tax=Rivularia sp. PCC 7116 TaxID=373994 RepID=UPI00029F1237|nr:murein biosynthesis integral membrane protein MurJ [Rivularia sp. PCC 7116]AFY54657.1 integral membrane protein MviN [Rivularia sp. PCC 7116]